MTKRLIGDFMYHGKCELLFTDENVMQEITINSVSELPLFLVTDLAYSFRGQSNSEWPIQSTFERLIKNKVSSLQNSEIENKILSKYRSEFSIFSSELGYDPRTQNTLDALSDIQHYGGPTRLVDWTSSFNIALFFAVFRNDGTDAAVYGLRNLVFNCATFDIRDLLKGQNFAPGAEESLPPALDKSKLLYMHTPARKNARISNQDGHFIYAGSADLSFHAALSYVFDDLEINYQKLKMTHGISIDEVFLRSSLIKVIIPGRLITDVKRYLKRAGLSMKALFPDFHGAIQSLYEVEMDYL